MEYEIITRKDALSQGLKHYFTGKPCKHGHISLKTVVNYACLACNQVSQSKRRSNNPEKARQLDRDLELKERISNPDKYKLRKRNSSLKTKFGINLEDYEEKLSKQGGVCNICQSGCPSGRALAVDHNHTTGQVRGLLCVKCNMALGLLDENPTKLVAMIKYLEEHSQV